MNIKANRFLLQLRLRGWLVRENLLTWLRPLIVIGVFLLSVLLAVYANQRLDKLLILLILGAGFIIIVLQKPPLGFIALVLFSLFLPSPFGGGRSEVLNTAILFVILLVGLWIFDMVTKRKVEIVPSRTNLPLFLLMAVAVISFLNGQIDYYSFYRSAPLTAQLGGLILFLISACAFLVTANQIKEEIWLKRLTWLFLSLAGLYILGRIIPGYGRNIRGLFQYGTAGSSIFWIWLVALASSQALFNRQLDNRWRGLLFGLVLATFYVSFGQAYLWKSGWLPPLVSLMVVLWLGFPRLRLPIVFSGLVVVVFSFANVEGLFTGGEDYSLLTRREAYRIILEIVKANPILGLGPSNYYWYTPLIPIQGHSVQFSSHNNYIDIIAQIGFLGLACFLWFAWEIGHLGWQLIEKVPEGFTRAYVYGALGGLVGTLFAGMLGDWIIPFVYNVGYVSFRASVLGWLFLGGLVVIEQNTRQSEE